MNNQPFNLNQMGSGNLSVGSATPNTLSVSGGSSTLGTLPVTGAPDTTANAPTAQPQQKGNWFTHLLPTAGSIIGGIAGIPLEALDAFTGVGGTAANIALAGAGGGAGKALENYLEGNKISSGVLGSAALGAGGQGVGEVASAVAKPLLSGAGNLLKSGSTAVLKGQFAKGTVDTATSDALQQMGINGSQGIKPVADIVTGRNGVFPNYVSNALKSSDTAVNVSPLNDTLNQLLLKNGGQLAGGKGAVTDIQNTFTQLLSKAIQGDATIVGKSGEFVPNIGALQNVLPENAFALTKDLEEQATAAAQAGAFSKISPQPAQRALYNIYSGLADKAEEIAFGGGTQMPLTAAMKEDILNQLTPLQAVNQKAYNYFVNKLSDPAINTVQQLRGIQQPIVKGSIAVDKSAEIAERAGGASAGQVIKGLAETAAPVGLLATGNIPGAVLAAVPGLLDTAAGRALTTSGLGKLGKAVAPTVTDAAGNVIKGGAVGRVAPTLARMGGIGAIQAAGNAGGAQPMNQNQLQGGGLPDTSGAALLGGMNAGAAAPAAGAAPAQAPAQGGGMGNLSLGDLLTLGYANPSFLSALGMTPDQRTKLAQSNQASAALDNLTNTFTSAGGAKGGLVGTLENIKSKFSKDEVNAFNSQKASVANQIANATGLDPKVIAQQMPSVTDTAQAAQDKIAALKAQIATSAQGAQVTALGGSNLSSLLGQVGGASAGGSAGLSSLPQFNYPSSSLPAIPGLTQ